MPSALKQVFRSPFTLSPLAYLWVSVQRLRHSAERLRCCCVLSSRCCHVLKPNYSLSSALAHVPNLSRQRGLLSLSASYRLLLLFHTQMSNGACTLAYHVSFYCECLESFVSSNSSPSSPFMTTHATKNTRNEKQARLEENTSKLSQTLMDSTMQHDDAQWRSHPSVLGAGPREEVRWDGSGGGNHWVLIRLDSIDAYSSSYCLPPGKVRS